MDISYITIMNFPINLTTTSLRPDSTAFSKHITIAPIIKLVVPWDTNISKKYQCKLNKYEQYNKYLHIQYLQRAFFSYRGWIGRSPNQIPSQPFYRLWKKQKK